MYPAPPLLPQSLRARARVRERGRFHDTRLEPALRLFFAHVGPGPHDKQEMQKIADGITLRLGQLAKMLPGEDNTFSLGDCGYAPTFLWIDALSQFFGVEVTYPDRVSRYREWLDTVPAVRDEMAQYKDAVEPWITAKLNQS